MNKVVNKFAEPFDVYIGRPTIFGNPFKISDSSRQEAISKYKDYFNNRIKNDKFFKDCIEQLQGKILGCYCKPQDCHGDVIVEYLDSIETDTSNYLNNE